MCITFEKGTQVPLDNPLVKVWTDCTRTHVIKNRPWITKNGILIEVKGLKKCHIIQICARLKFDTLSNDFVLQEYQTDGGNRTFSSKAAKEFYVDTENRSKPYYDVKTNSDNGTFVRTEESLMIWDNPTMGDTFDDQYGDGFLKLTALKQAGDWTKFIGIDYCLSDGGLVGIIKWSLKRTYGNDDAVYKVKECKDNTYIELGRTVLKLRGYNQDFLPNQRI